jgi:hypothetical protein
VGPGSKRKDKVIKRGEYADASIPHYWIIGPDPPLSLLDCHLAGPFGYQDGGDVTGTFVTTTPFPVRMELDRLLWGQGFRMTSRSCRWRRQFGERIPKLAATRQVIAADSKAMGGTNDIDRPLSSADLASDVVGLLQHLGVAQDGDAGEVAVDVAATQQQEPDRVVELYRVSRLVRRRLDLRILTTDSVGWLPRAGRPRPPTTRRVQPTNPATGSPNARIPP